MLANFKIFYKCLSTLSKLPNKELPLVSRVPSTCQNSVRFYSKGSGGNNIKVTVVGAAGHVGQPLSLMLKQSPLIDELCVYDTDGTGGFAMELAHVDTKCKVTGYSGMESLMIALAKSKIVVIVAASPRTTYLSYSAMFESNAMVVEDIAQNIARYCPRALVAVASNPVNSLVPLVSEVLNKNGCYNPGAIFGVTTLDVVRANTFVAEVQGIEPECVIVPVIGGHADKTIVPILSQAKPCAEFTNDELEKITTAIQNAHHDIVKVKANESATLSTAFAIARFVISLVKGLRGQQDIIECTYVRSPIHPNAKYLSTPVQLGPTGVMKHLGLPEMTEYENCQLENAIPLIMQDVKRGEMFVGVQDPPPCDPCDAEPSAPLCPPDWCEKRQSF